MVKTKKPGTRIIALCHIVIVEMAVASLEIKAVSPDCQSKGLSLINQHLDVADPA